MNIVTQLEQRISVRLPILISSLSWEMYAEDLYIHI